MEVNVVFLGGQSNAVSVRACADANYCQVDNDIYIYNTDTSKIEVMEPGINTNSLNAGVRSGVENTLAKELKIKFGKPVIIFKVCQGDTSLERDWNPDDASSLYPNIPNHYATLLTEASAMGFTLNWLGSIWIQGEKDASNLGFANRYSQNFTRFHNALILDIPPLDGKVVVVTRLRTTNPHGSLTQFLPQQQLIGDNNSFVRLYDTENLQDVGDNVHYGERALLQIGLDTAHYFLNV